MKTQELMELFGVLADDRAGSAWKETDVVVLLNLAQRDLQNEVEKVDHNFFTTFEILDVVATPNDDLEFDLTALAKPFRLDQRVERIRAKGPPIPIDKVDFDKRMEYGSWDWLEDIFGPSPQVYYVRGTKLGIVRPPDAYSARLHYHYQIPDLDLDGGDESEIPVAYHHLIAHLAAREAKVSEGARVTPQEDLKVELGKRDLRTHVGRRKPILEPHTHLGTF